MGKVLDRKFKAAAAGFTLVELLVVVAIVLIIVSGIVTVGGTVRTQAKIRNTESTIRMLESALTEYNNYKKIGFPPSCGDKWFADLLLIIDPSGVLTGNAGGHDTVPSSGWEDWSLLGVGDQDNLLTARSSIEILYFMLDRVPDCQKYLSRIAEEFKTNEDGDFLVVNNDAVSLIEVNDAWQRPIRYETLAGENFPELISAGPDGLFITADDIISTEMQL